MLTVAERSPLAEGSKRTWNVVEAPGPSDRVAGCARSWKSAAWVPVMVTGSASSVSTSFPVFWIVKVRVTVPPATSALPKSVWSAVVGVVSPSRMSWELPCTLMSGPAAKVHTSVALAARALPLTSQIPEPAAVKVRVYVPEAPVIPARFPSV